MVQKTIARQNFGVLFALLLVLAFSFWAQKLGVPAAAASTRKKKKPCVCATQDTVVQGPVLRLHRGSRDAAHRRAPPLQTASGIPWTFILGRPLTLTPTATHFSLGKRRFRSVVVVLVQPHARARVFRVRLIQRECIPSSLLYCNKFARRSPLLALRALSPAQLAQLPATVRDDRSVNICPVRCGTVRFRQKSRLRQWRKYGLSGLRLAANGNFSTSSVRPIPHPTLSG